MSRLILVRHGQAVSDRLTKLGERQAEALAERWISNGLAPDVVWHGTLQRQQRTAEVVQEAFVRAGLPFPAPQLLPGLDEYPAEGALERLAPILAERDDVFASLEQAWRAGGPPEKANARFQRMFEPLMQAWQSGEVADSEVESWEAFSDRVRKALKTMTQGRSLTVAAFTSGGTIGTIVQQALGAPDSAALELNWRLRNGSLTTFLFHEGRVTLDRFNDTGHLTEGLETFR